MLQNGGHRPNAGRISHDVPHLFINTSAEMYIPVGRISVDSVGRISIEPSLVSLWFSFCWLHSTKQIHFGRIPTCQDWSDGSGGRITFWTDHGSGCPWHRSIWQRLFRRAVRDIWRPSQGFPKAFGVLLGRTGLALMRDQRSALISVVVGRP